MVSHISQKYKITPPVVVNNDWHPFQKSPAKSTTKNNKTTKYQWLLV
jgi:hypothetical protein